MFSELRMTSRWREESHETNSIRVPPGPQPLSCETPSPHRDSSLRVRRYIQISPVLPIVRYLPDPTKTMYFLPRHRHASSPWNPRGNGRSSCHLLLADCNSALHLDENSACPCCTPEPAARSGTRTTIATSINKQPTNTHPTGLVSTSSDAAIQSRTYMGQGSSRADGGRRWAACIVAKISARRKFVVSHILAQVSFLPSLLLWLRGYLIFFFSHCRAEEEVICAYLLIQKNRVSECRRNASRDVKFPVVYV